jgi:glycosyltransferase involved in cell wall biosynthesis
MKVLMLNTYEQRGGAARATWRLFRGLQAAGAEVRLLVQEKTSGDQDVVKLPSPLSGMLNPFRPYIDFAIPLLQTRKRILFSTALLPDQLMRAVNEYQPDIVHLNWITGGFIRLETLAKIPCPVIWTLHDMWAFTGGCHNSTQCDRYLVECGKCPVLHSGKENDLSRKTFLRKKRTYNQMQNLTLTAPSSWLAGQIKESILLKNKNVKVIFNGLDTNIFKPAGRLKARQRLGLEAEKTIVVYGAIRATETPLKGFQNLIEALRILRNPSLKLVVFGSSGPAGTDISGLDVDFKGSVSQDDTLTDLYSAADVVAVPSYQEVFGQAATEAMACGTPVVAFGCTGLLDLVKHQETGFLATPFQPESLASGISWVLEDDARHEKLCRQARDHAVKNFDISIVSSQFIQLYQEVRNETRS